MASFSKPTLAFIYIRRPEKDLGTNGIIDLSVLHLGHRGVDIFSG